MTGCFAARRPTGSGRTRPSCLTHQNLQLDSLVYRGVATRLARETL